MDALSLRIKYHTETGDKPLYPKQPVARTYENRMHYDSYKKYVGNKVYELGLISFKYVTWMERKIEDLFGIWKDDIHKLYKKETGNPVYNYNWLEDYFLKLINKNKLKYV